VAYTGYVTTPAPSSETAATLRQELGLSGTDKLILASAGGGNVGEPLLKATLETFARLEFPGAHLQIFTGPYLDDAHYAALKRRAMEIPNARVERFTDRFPAWLATADCSVSQAGYNTTMNLLTAGTPALVLPFAQNREQRMRAERLAHMDGPEVLDESDLDPARLAQRMETLLSKPRGTLSSVDLDGAATTARMLEDLAESAA
jgi:predicted glycosyltransferase